MKTINKIFISYVVTSCFTTLSVAGDSIVIQNSQKHPIELDSDSNLTITSTGSFIVSDSKSIPYTIYSGNYNADLINNGIISTRAYSDSQGYKYAAGISMDVLENNGSIVNNGDIDTTGQSNSVAINISTLHGVVVNSGNINVKNTEVYGIETSSGNGTIVNDTNGTILAYTGIYISKDSSIDIINRGKISYSSLWWKGIGILASSSFEGSLINDTTGTINEGIVINQLDGTLVNDGNITQNSLSYKGIYVSTLNGTITNEKNGNITGNYAIYVDNVNIGGNIINNGTLEHNAQGSIYIQDLNGTITNNGTISDCIAIKVENGTGEIINSKSAQISYTGIPIYTNNFTGNFTNDGLIDAYGLRLDNANLVNNGTLSLHADTTEVGSFTQTKNSILKISLHIDKYDKNDEEAGDLANTIYVQYPKIISKGAINIEDGSILFVDVTGNGLENEWKDDNGTLSSVLESQNSTINVNLNNFNILDNSALLDFIAVLSKDKKSLDLLTKKNLIEKILLSLGSGYMNAGKILDNMNNTDDDSINTFLSKLKTLNTDQEVADAVAGTTPAIITSMSMLNTLITMGVSNVVEMRQSALRGLNSGDKTFTNRYLWIKPYGGYTKQNNKDGLLGFSANSYGIGIGIDSEYSSGKRLGLAFFYTNADVDTNSINQSSKLDVYSIVAYGGKPFYNNKTFLDYQIGASIQKTKTSREILGIGTATANFNSKSLFLETKFSQNYQCRSNIMLTPSIKAIYKYYNSPSYSENGVGDIGLNVNGYSRSEFILGLGSDVKYKLSNGMIITSLLALNYNFNNNSQIVSASYQDSGGIYFDTNGIKNSALEYKVGLGISKKLKKGVAFDIKYNFSDQGNSYKNSSIYVKLRWRF